MTDTTGMTVMEKILSKKAKEAKNRIKHDTMMLSVYEGQLNKLKLARAQNATRQLKEDGTPYCSDTELDI